MTNYELPKYEQPMRTENKRQPAFGDLDKMWFGKHKDIPLQDVPAHYLKWLKGQLEESGYNKITQEKFESLTPPMKKNAMLYNYIHNSWEELKRELNEI